VRNSINCAAIITN